MRLERIFLIGLCLVLSMGLIFVNVGICQQTKPDESGTQQPAVSPEGKASTPAAQCPTPAKVPEQPEQAKPAEKPTAPEQPSAKVPRKWKPKEGC